jgi:hypothetical protein
MQQSLCDEMTNEYQQSMLQIFVGHLITLAVYISLLLLAVDPYFATTLLQTRLVCLLKRSSYSLRVILGISDSLRS